MATLERRAAGPGGLCLPCAGLLLGTAAFPISAVQVEAAAAALQLGLAARLLPCWLQLAPATHVLPMEGLLLAQREGRLLMRTAEFSKAAEVYTAALGTFGTAALAQATIAPAAAVAADSQPPPSAPPTEAGSTAAEGQQQPAAAAGKLLWSAGAGSLAEVALSTRLLLARALMCAADKPDGSGARTRFDAAIAEAEGVASSDRLASTSPLRHEALKHVAKLCGLAGGVVRLATGVECCRLLRAPAAGLAARDPFEDALVSELQAGLHALGCSCLGAAPRWDSCSTSRPAPAPADSRCTCEAGAAALAAMETCVASGKEHARKAHAATKANASGGGVGRKSCKRQEADLVLLRAWRGLAEHDKVRFARPHSLPEGLLPCLSAQLRRRWAGGGGGGRGGEAVEEGEVPVQGGTA